MQHLSPRIVLPLLKKHSAVATWPVNFQNYKNESFSREFKFIQHLPLSSNWTKSYLLKMILAVASSRIPRKECLSISITPVSVLQSVFPSPTLETAKCPRQMCRRSLPQMYAPEDQRSLYIQTMQGESLRIAP